MKLASHALEEALFQHLIADVELLALLSGPAIYRQPRRNRPFPYMTIESLASRDWDTSTDYGGEHTLRLHVWEDGQKHSNVQSILSHLMVSLRRADLNLEDHHLVNLQLRSSEILPERKNRLMHGVLQLRAITEEAD